MVSFPEVIRDYEWSQEYQVPATGAARSAGFPPVFSAVSMNRAGLNEIVPHRAHAHPHLAQVEPQLPIHRPGYPNRQDEFSHFTGNAPILAPQPPGPTNSDSCVRYNVQGIADKPSYGRWSEAPFDSHGAFTLEISEGAVSGGTGALTNVGCVDESGLGPWTMSTAGAVEYGARAQQGFLPGYTHGVQPFQFPFDSRTREHVEQNGGGGEFKFYQSWSVPDDLVLK